MLKQIKTGLFMGGVAALVLGVAGCGKKSGALSREGDAEVKEESLAVGTLTAEQVMRARCPHGSTLECDECRYEVGVVKVDPSLLKQDGVPGTGLVKTHQAGRSKMTTAVDITGEIRLNENTAVHLSPRIAGVIRTVNVDIGAEVGKDDILFTVDSVDLGQALGDYARNMALADLSGKTLQREKNLLEQKAGSGGDLIEAQMRFEDHQAAWMASRQRLHVLGFSEADLAAFGTANSNGLTSALSVRSPMRGKVIEKHAAAGELVEPGRDVMVLADLDSVWMWGGVYERDLGLLLKRNLADGIPVEITVPAFPDTRFLGQMNHIGSVMDASTRTIPVRILVDNKDRRLRPGMFCQGRILVSTDEDVLAIPRTALLSDEGVDFVFTHMKDDYFLRVNVTRGREFAEGIEILKGLTPGQVVVTEGAFILKSDVLKSKMGAGCAD